MASSEVGFERRLAAPHPGPVIKRDYVDALGIGVPELARAIDLDPVRLEAMLAGRVSLDADAAIRLSRGLQLPAERIMQMQIRADFARARDVEEYTRLAPVAASGGYPFPAGDHLRGRLGRTSDDAAGHVSFFFQEDVPAGTTEPYAGLHALWRGDVLRIYEDGAVVWVGPILQNLDGRTLLPFVSAAEWRAWFAANARADLAIGPDHAEFFARMSDA